jgi:hypothetical protein
MGQGLALPEHRYSVLQKKSCCNIMSVRQCVIKSPPVGSILSQYSPVSTYKTYFSNINFNIIFLQMCSYVYNCPDAIPTATVTFCWVVAWFVNYESESERKWSQIFKVLSRHLLETEKNQERSQDSRPSGRDLNSEIPEYEAGVRFGH